LKEAEIIGAKIVLVLVRSFWVIEGFEWLDSCFAK